MVSKASLSSRLGIMSKHQNHLQMQRIPGVGGDLFSYLYVKRKLGFINGACKHLTSLPESNGVVSMIWLYLWISNALSKDIADSVMNSKTAKELWDSLEQRFGKSNGAKLYHLQKELTGLVQGNSDIAGYFTKLKRLWDELDGINVIMRTEREVYANAHFTPILGSFMAIGQAKQPNNTLFGRVSAFMANGQGRNARKLKSQAMRGPSTYQKYNNSNQRTAKPQNKFRGKKKYDPNVSCTYCEKIGHVHDDCYEDHGFRRFEFTNPRNYQPRIKANASLTHE
ncbi:uncharacterized protein LOC132061082 [Lycium ferocissimum]|uniref:uncharacterized protein LOC132061082 n=1 Tax=Lycium ferocissimum TaxID=112874 RepID=UPI0028167E0D|nr:uncharacterized protein LOC132061082 [Lycium ferocissimum]